MSFIVFDEGGAAFHPISRIAVYDVAHWAFFGAMYVAANNPIDIARARRRGDGVFIAADILDGVFDFFLEEGGQRPVRKPQTASRRVEPVVDRQRGGIGAVAQIGEPLGEFDDAVELITVQHQIAFAVGGDMNGLVDDGNRPEIMICKIAKIFVVVAGNVDDPRTLARLAQ